MKTKAKKTMDKMIDKERKQLQTLENKMAAFIEDKGKMPTDEEIRELCRLRSQFKLYSKYLEWT